MSSEAFSGKTFLALALNSVAFMSSMGFYAWGAAFGWAFLTSFHDGATAGVITLGLLTAIWLTVAHVIFTSCNTKNPLNGLPTRNALERVAEIMDLSKMSEVPLSYNDAVRFEQQAHRQLRWRIARAFSLNFAFACLLLSLVGVPLAFGLGLALTAALVAVGTHLRMRALRKNTPEYMAFMKEAVAKLAEMAVSEK